MQKVGKIPLVVRIGPKKGRIYHSVLLSVAALCYVLFATSTAFSSWHFLFYWHFHLLLKHPYLFIVAQKRRIEKRRGQRFQRLSRMMVP